MPTFSLGDFQVYSLEEISKLSYPKDSEEEYLIVKEDKSNIFYDYHEYVKYNQDVHFKMNKIASKIREAEEC